MTSDHRLSYEVMNAHYSAAFSIAGAGVEGTQVRESHTPRFESWLCQVPLRLLNLSWISDFPFTDG